MFCSILPLNQKNNHIKETEQGLFGVPNLVPLLIFIVNILGNVTDQWVTYSGGRGVIIGGRRLIEEQLLFEEIWLLNLHPARGGVQREGLGMEPATLRPSWWWGGGSVTCNFLICISKPILLHIE